MDRRRMHPKLPLRVVEDERGVSLIIVAVMILVLTAMSSLVLDYGVVWLGRRQAQNAADAGALAGAQALAKDDSAWAAGALNSLTDRSANGVAQANKVLGAVPGTEALAECPGWMVAPNNVNCVEVNVYRDGTHGSAAMPVFFATLLGQTSQNIRATATAQVIAANSSGCMRPWFIPDRYNEVNGVAGYQNPPDTLNPYDIPGDIGVAVTFNDNVAPSSYGTLDVGAGADDVAKAIGHCVANKKFSIGQTQTTDTEPGGEVGPKEAAIQNLLDWDKLATWDATKKQVVGGCSVTGTCVCADKFNLPCPYGGTQSPRIVQAAVCGPPTGDCSGANGKGSITISNILSFFIVGCNGVVGTCKADKGKINIDAILIGSAGLFDPAGGSGAGKSFVTVQMLVR